MPAKPIDPKYSIGVQEIDAQHAHLLALVEEFRAAAAGRLLEPRGFDAAGRALEKLLAYARFHFPNEERFMAERGFPDLEAHCRQHRELEAEVVRLLDEIRLNETNTTPIKLNLFVTVWLMEHILQEDHRYGRFVREAN